jgi:hypothetical protein
LPKQKTGGGCIPGGQLAEDLEPTGKKKRVDNKKLCDVALEGGIG